MRPLKSSSRARWTIWRIRSLPASSLGWAFPAKRIYSGRSLSAKSFEVLDIAEEQITAFIGGEAPGKADGQRLGGEDRRAIARFWPGPLRRQLTL